MKKKFKKIPYKYRIALIILAFSLMPCALLGNIYLGNTLSDEKESILADYQYNTDTVAMLMSNRITVLKEKMQFLLNDYELRSYLSKIDDLSLLQALDMIAATDEAVSSITAGNSDMAVRWYSYKSALSYGNYHYTLERFAEEFPEDTEDPSYREILTLQEGEFLWKVRTIAREANNRGTPQEMLCLYTQITDLRTPTCVLEFSIPVNKLVVSNKGLPNVSDSLFSICLNQTSAPLNIILSSTLNSEIHEELLMQYQNTGKVTGYEIVRSEISNTTDGEVIYLVPKAYVSALIRPKIIGYIGIALVVVLGMLCTCYLTSYFLTRKIINAVNTLTVDLNHILAEPLQPDYRHSDDEIGQIVLQVHKLIQDTQEYCAKIEHYETEALRMELELLQMRFDPHLLYNTLDAINHQIRNPIARSTIDSLCSYYRIVLNNGHLLIRIADEIDMIQKYFSIVKFTYGLNDITCDFDIDEQVKQYSIIKHVLQPIVENAINHGIRPTGRGGMLRITAFADKDDICIQVTDNGVGMPEEKRKRLLEEPSASIYGGGYGIYNVHQRIHVYYGHTYGLHIDSSETGTMITMRIPKS